ncbi:MAG: transglycosylase SLT domain-containing protein, partial [Rickettsiales bacterium]
MRTSSFIALRLLVLGTCLSGAPAMAEDISTSFSSWQQLRDPAAATIQFMDGARFLYDHPGWPDEKTIRLRTEAAALFERPGKQVMSKFCTDFPPLSGRGMFACASAGVGDAKQQSAWVSKGWVQGDFNEAEENAIRMAYGARLTSMNHRARIDRLLYEGKLVAAKRMIPLTPTANHALYTTRIAFIQNDKKAPQLFKKLNVSYQRDTGLLYDRARWRLRKGDDEFADLVALAPSDAPCPDRWWPLRIRAARDAIGTGQYARALKFINQHGALEGEDLAEALWTKGWLNLRHRKDAGTAYKQFFALYTSTNTPVSKARAAYWAGRAAEKNGNRDIASEWMQKAAARPTVFYGQLAIGWLQVKPTLTLPTAKKASDAEQAQFDSDELVRVIKLVDYTGGTPELRDKFITAAAARMRDNEAKLALLAELSKNLGGVATGVEAAKLALRNGTVLTPHGWPRIALPAGLPIEPALTLAITRQESEFNPDARSPANAQGLMQLLPGTAKHVAKEMEVDFKPSMITDPAVNLTLGSRYLGQLISGFDGSYILGIASYNAGPGNVRGWIRNMGMPPKKLDAAIDWIESIPFTETRN